MARERPRQAPQPRVLLVDDHPLFRRGVRGLLEREGVQVVAEASTGAEGVELAGSLDVDVVVMDLGLPGMSGVEATRRICQLSPSPPVLVLTVSTREADVLEAIAAGARGYLLKGAPAHQLVAGVRSAAAGESLVSPAILAGLFERLREQHESEPPQGGLGVRLSDREVEVLRLVARGAGNVEIGRELHISPHTVKAHISAILAKLGVANRIQAAVLAVRAGIV